MERERLEKAFELSTAFRYAEALEEFRKIAETTEDPLTKAWALLMTSDVLVQMSENKRAEQALKDARTVLDFVGVSSDRDLVEQRRLTYMAELQEIEIINAGGNREEALERYKSFLKRGKDERERLLFSDAYEHAEGIFQRVRHATRSVLSEPLSGCSVPQSGDGATGCQEIATRGVRRG